MCHYSLSLYHNILICQMKGFYEMSETIKSYKGFDKDLKCRGFQYEIGKEYEEPEADVCRAGFHACERPLDVFNHYCPVNSRFCEVEQSGELSRDTDDSKVASTKIKIGAEIGIPGLVKAQIEWVKAHTTTEHTDPERATAGDRGAATAGSCGVATAGSCGVATAGNRGAATAGNRGAATAGDCGAATAGDCGAATAGSCGAATAGSCGAATARGEASVGENGLAVARGNNVRVKGGLGAVLVIAEENESDYDIKDWAAVLVDGETIKPDTFYMLKDGVFVEVE